VLALAPLPQEWNPFRRVRGSADLAANTARLAREHNAGWIVAGDYQTAALLSFYLPGRPFVFLNNAAHVQNQYSFWPTYGAQHVGGNALFVSRGRTYPKTLEREFEAVRPSGPLVSRHAGRTVRVYGSWMLLNLKNPIPPPGGPPAPAAPETPAAAPETVTAPAAVSPAPPPLPPDGD
jgi:hypothetical protein